MESGDVERRLAAILSADVVGYSRLMAQDEVATVRTLTAYRDQLDVLVRQHRGRVVDAPGDNILAEFPSATDALQCAGEFQRVIQARNGPLAPERRMEFRVGVHLGEVMVEGTRIYGDGVNIASRLEGLAEPGGICISGTVHDQVETKVRVRYEDLGDQEVKNIARPVHVYRARWEEVRPAAPTAAEPAAAAPASLRRAPLLMIAHLAGAVVLVALVWGAYQWYRGGASPALFDGPSIAVLPFANLSDDAAQEYFADGLTEDLITDLSHVSGLTVIARNTVFTYKGKAVKVQDVGSDLGVSHVLEGSVRKAGGQVRITAQLVDATDGSHVWAERFDRPLEDIFALQDEVTRSIVGALQVKLDETERGMVEKPLTDSPEAYELYLQGLVAARGMGPESNARAQELFERAIEVDNDFGPAHADLASAMLGGWYAGYIEGEEIPGFAAALCDTALELDGYHAPSLAAAASAYQEVGRLEDALAAADRASEIAPGSASAHRARSIALAAVGRFEEASREIELAYRLNPLDPVTAFNAAGLRFRMGDHEAAVSRLTRAIQATPDFIGLHGVLAVTYAEMGRMDEARAQVSEVLRLNPEFSIDTIATRSMRNDDPEWAARIIAAARKAGLPEGSVGESE